MDESTRRQFLKRLSVAGATLAVSGFAGLAASAAGPASRPKGAAGSGRQWAMVIDLRKCEGCVTIDKPAQCTVACNQAHFLQEGQPWLKVYEIEAFKGSYFQPTLCMQCENAPCVRVCPVGATYHNPSGVVLIDNRDCIGCRMCMAACPYGVRTFNWSEPPSPPGVGPEDYTPETSVPQKKGTASKCMFCAHKAMEGKLPACAEGCPMFALYFGDLNEDVATNGKEIVRLSDFLATNHAFQLKPEYGTRPRVWYIAGHGEAFGRGLGS